MKGEVKYEDDYHVYNKNLTPLHRGEKVFFAE